MLACEDCGHDAIHHVDRVVAACAVDEGTRGGYPKAEHCICRGYTATAKAAPEPVEAPERRRRWWPW